MKLGNGPQGQNLSSAINTPKFNYCVSWMAYLWSLWISVSVVCCESRPKGAASWACAQAIVEVGSCHPPSNSFIGWGSSLMFDFSLSLVFRINGKWSNMIFPLKNFPNICDPCYILPHPLPKDFYFYLFGNLIMFPSLGEVAIYRRYSVGSSSTPSSEDQRCML